MIGLLSSMLAQADWVAPDIDWHALMVEKVHAHGALAGVELWHGGAASANHYSREAPLGPASMPAGVNDPVQTRAMDKADIRELKRWHVEAARRAWGRGPRVADECFGCGRCGWYPRTWRCPGSSTTSMWIWSCALLALGRGGQAAGVGSPTHLLAQLKVEP